MVARTCPKTPIDGSLCLEFVAALPLRELPAKKPDLDNLAKQLKDAMTRMQFWRDDSQIVKLNCSKNYAETPYWMVTLRTVLRK